MSQSTRSVNQREAVELQRRYAGVGEGASVAYVDESYRLVADCRPGEEPFYVLAAVVLPKADHDGIRVDLDRIAGHTKWHTTERQRTEQGRLSVEEMVDYLASYGDPCVIAVSHTPREDETGRTMRNTCLKVLLAELCGSGSAPILPAPVPMVVFEKQREQKDTDRDCYIIRQAIKEGHIPRSTVTQFVSPAIENLLWLPDLVSNTYRRYVTHQDQLVKRLDAQTVTVEIPLEASDPLAAAAHVQGVSPLFP